MWALQQGANVVLVGRSNRSKVLFEQELNAAMDDVDELPPPPPPPPASSNPGGDAVAAPASAMAAAAVGARQQ